ncbi:MAG TPA: Hsp20/alpha crystallin family protein [Bacteroidota bacterium]|nr:Hsp20/alpha crystallin family protein [Bacteroidota bacterium]
MLARLDGFPSFSPLVGEVLGLGAGFDSLFAGSFEPIPAEDAAFAPRLDVAENGDELLVVAEIPGVKKEDVKIAIEKGILTIGGERKTNGLSGAAHTLVREQRQGKFTRRVRLPYEVNAAGVSAELADGLLKIVLPKAEAAKAHEVSVK